MTLDSALCVKPGHRVEFCGYYGTVCYVGEVPPKKGTWLGVDWDDPTRGKHSGTHEGKKYFNTRYVSFGLNSSLQGSTLHDLSPYFTQEGLSDKIYLCKITGLLKSKNIFKFLRRREHGLTVFILSEESV
jgi:dynactin complex subunit